MTIRGLDPQLAGRLKERARLEGKSANQLVLDMLRTHLGLEKAKHFTAVHRDMDHLFGRWSEQEFAEVQARIEAQRGIDEELWQ